MVEPMQVVWTLEAALPRHLAQHRIVEIRPSATTMTRDLVSLELVAVESAFLQVAHM